MEHHGYNVWLPDMPDTDLPELSKWLPFALENGKYDKETILIGHSCGASLVLSILENVEVRIKKAILVAGFIKPLIDEPDPILQDSYNWAKIKSNCEKFIIINSDNDPWGCDDKMGKLIADNVGGELIILHDGHMGSDKFNQPYKEFPLILKLLGYNFPNFPPTFTVV